MISIYTGADGQGITKILEQLVEEYAAKGYKVITNIVNAEYNGFDQNRLSVVMSDDVFENIFYYCELLEKDNQLIFNPDDISSTGELFSSFASFSKVLTLICREGQVLILDKPDIGLHYTDTIALSHILNLLEVTYECVVIATKASYLFWVANKAYIVSNCKSTEISLKELSNYI